MSSPGAEQLHGRPIIGLGDEIIGGVMLSHTALVVDVAERPECYEELYAKVMGRLDDDSPLVVAQTVAQVVQEEIPVSRPMVVAILKDTARQVGKERVGLMDEIGLSEYLERRGGMCHQQALAAGVMIRFMQRREGLGGSVDVDRISNGAASHAWGRWAIDKQPVIILDPALDYVADLRQDLSRKSRMYRHSLGRYVRPLRQFDRFGS